MSGPLGTTPAANAAPRDNPVDIASEGFTPAPFSSTHTQLSSRARPLAARKMGMFGTRSGQKAGNAAFFMRARLPTGERQTTREGFPSS